MAKFEMDVCPRCGGVMSKQGDVVAWEQSYDCAGCGLNISFNFHVVRDVEFYLNKVVTVSDVEIVRDGESIFYDEVDALILGLDADDGDYFMCELETADQWDGARFRVAKRTLDGIRFEEE